MKIDAIYDSTLTVLVVSDFLCLVISSVFTTFQSYESLHIRSPLIALLKLLFLTFCVTCLQSH